MKYRFTSWENGETSAQRTLTLSGDLAVTANYAVVTKRLTFASQPVGVQAVVNGQTINAGQSVDLPEGTQVTIVVPGEVSV